MDEKLEQALIARSTRWGNSAFKEGWRTYISGTPLPDRFYRYSKRTQGVFMEGYNACKNRLIKDAINAQPLPEGDEWFT